MQLLTEYANKYFMIGKLPETKDNIDAKNENVMMNDRMRQFIDEKYDIDNNITNTDDYIYRETFLEEYNNYHNSDVRELRYIISDMKRVGVKYDSQMQLKYKKGFVVNLRRKTENKTKQ